ncbi:MAG: L-lactate dehydrogenase [Candidatus Pacebacteria bacterium CG_4_9_14_3_um_filter_40_12]|nr:MAG: L-lactate dehydrogenase [Candidatus Pacebacteria bacterium CG10_big_fil_rev_8_21_14_0_10_40_26]PIZ79615.1 MAG: L-lactate dehydrogenase [Candidatus Pacebacteria bacterium CG_4_10_14_0_2_um_filter_40_20]PJA69068.1 MAG: L-lactate dehydrogenase [Candidatus Pacebacteria bacterium CG_4_9_14_3_um_filter_40_12]PJC41798.1 MAG: L-lactate dehydrogenase [Candidatus Pacebacteria bacterium CG_4_9_14_0_2_um_filter_40_15]
MKSMKNQNKISIIGCGNVGMTAAYSILHKGDVDELVLFGRNKQALIGEELDLEHGLSFLSTAKITAADTFDALEGSDVIVYTAGAAQKPGETRLDLTKKNVAILEGMIPEIVKHAPDAVILIVANPVDILTYKAYVAAGLPKGRIFGSGTTLDTARFRFHLSQFMNVHPRSIHAYVLGEHGDHSFPALSNANIGGQNLNEFPNFTEEKALRSYQKARTAAYKIIESKGATYYAIGADISSIVSTILKDKRSVLAVSIPLHNYYGLNGVALSVPCIVGRNGVEQVLKANLSSHEQKLLQRAAAALKEYL